MIKRKRKSAIRPIAEMNLTPMMDLTFLLLIAFIITFPLVESSIEVRLPQHKVNAPQDINTPSAVITVDKDGRFFYGDEVIELEDLSSRLDTMKKEKEEVRVVIRGDVEANYGAVVEVAKIVNKLGIKSMALASREQ